MCAPIVVVYVSVVSLCVVRSVFTFVFVFMFVSV